MITVACVWVRANVPYGVEYVTRLRDMVAKHLPVEHRFVCLTDRPWQLPEGVESIPIAWPTDVFGWWAKLLLFKTGHFDGRVLYLDLDSLIVSSLAPIMEFPSSFALIPDGGSAFQPKTHHQVVKCFNSSVMVWEAGINSQLADYVTPAVMHKYWGDQDVIGAEWPHANTMPLEWFPRLSAIQGGPVPPEAIVVLAKKPKPEEAARRWPWVDAAWRAA